MATKSVPLPTQAVQWALAAQISPKTVLQWAPTAGQRWTGVGHGGTGEVPWGKAPMALNWLQLSPPNGHHASQGPPQVCGGGGVQGGFKKPKHPNKIAPD